MSDRRSDVADTTGAPATGPDFGPVVLPPIRERTIAHALAAVLATAPDRAAVTDPQGTLSYAQLHTRALALAGGLARLGIARSEPVLLMLDNHADAVVTWVGLALTGRVEVPVNTAYRGSILAHVVNNAGARAIVIEAGYLPVLADVAERLTTLATVIVRGDAQRAESLTPGTGTPADALRTLTGRPGGGLAVLPFESLPGTPAEPVALEPWDLMGILYTSGTTGLSKGVRVTQAHAYGYCTPRLYDRERPDEVTLVTLPLFHIGGQWAGVYKSFIAGGEAVVLPRFSATTWWEDVRRYRCTYTLLLGAMANFLYRQPPSPDDRRHTLRRVTMVPVIPEMQAFCERFGIEGVATGYGLTEGSTILRAPLGHAEPGIAGYLRPDFEARIVDAHDLDVPEGQVGELIVRTRDPWAVMDGYHAMPEATVAAWRNQWLHTGDAVRRDAQGRWWFVDRMKDALRRRGENVSSFEVESEINAHPAVLESAVVGVPSDSTEDDVLACVVLKPGQVLTADALFAFLDPRLPDFMVPRYLEFVDALPKTPTEKIQKQVLRSRGVGPATVDRGPGGASARRRAAQPQVRPADGTPATASGPAATARGAPTRD